MSESYASAAYTFDVQHISDLLGRVMRDQAWALKSLKSTRGVDSAVHGDVIKRCAEIRQAAQKVDCLKEDQVAERDQLFQTHSDIQRREARILETMLADLRETVIIETTRPRSLFRRIFG